MIDKLKTLIGASVSLDHELGDDEDLLMSGVLDSISAMKLVASIEQEFDLKVPATDITFENFQTVQAMADYIATRLS